METPAIRDWALVKNELRNLLSLLEGCQPADSKESSDLEAMKRFASSLAEPFSRSELPAHFTGSAVVIDPAGERVCLVHHARFNRWLQPGGHAESSDGGSILSTAIREAREEMGCEVDLHPIAPRPFDVDVHSIPQHGAEPAHLHLDVRFLAVASKPQRAVHNPAESHAAKWLSWQEALAIVDEPALRRLLEKARHWAQQCPSPG